jgi:hypothetical protein
MTRITSIESEELAGTAYLDGTAIRCCLRGTADRAERDVLDRFVRTVHSAIIEIGDVDAVVDIRGLEFMSASCSKCLLTWITGIQALDDNRRYKIVFWSSAALAWQQRTLELLRTVATDLVTIVPS